MNLPIFDVIQYWRTRLQASSDEYKAWYLVPLLVLLALGATVLLGALAWCMMHGQNLGFVVNAGAGKYGVMCVKR
jgi:hypothetical protein